jgi:predicted permease
MLGVRAVLGRTLEAVDEHNASTGIPVVLGYRFWKHSFSGSGSVIGEQLVVQGRPFTIVGVMPESFYGMSLDTVPDLWIPVSAQPLLSSKSLTDAQPDRHFGIVARLKRGVPASDAQAEFANLFQELKRQAGDNDVKRTGQMVPVEQGSFALRDQFARALTLLLWGLVLLLAMVAASVAGVLVVRQLRRERDNAIRIALGASRARIIRRVFRESLLLGVVGAAGGLAVAYLSASLFRRLLPRGAHGLPISLTPDLRTCLITVALAVTLSIVFGVLPAWTSSKADPQQALRGGSATGKTGVLSRAILMVQTAGAFVLLASAGLLIHTFYVLQHTNPGFDAEHLVAFAVDPGIRGQMPVAASFPQELERRIAVLPGVRGASLVSAPLMQRLGMKTTVAQPGQKISADSFLNTSFDNVSESFFNTMGMSVVAGRSFSSADIHRDGPVPTVVNEAFAHFLFPDQDPVGKTFGAGPPGEIAKPASVIVGVASDSKYRSLREAYLPIYYQPIEKRVDWTNRFYLYVRTYGEPSSVIQQANHVLASLEPQLPFSSVITMPQQLSDSLWQERLLSVLAGLFSGISVLIAAIGLYGLLAYDVGQRRREFGIRCALGAQRSAVLTLLVKEMARILVPGILLGAVACVFLTRTIKSLLYGITAFDPVSSAAALGVVLLLAAISAFGPLRSAMQVEPARVLREE